MLIGRRKAVAAAGESYPKGRPPAVPPYRRWQAALACGAAKLRLDPESLKRHTWPGPFFGLDGRFDMTHASAPVGTRVFLCFAMPW